MYKIASIAAVGLALVACSGPAEAPEETAEPVAASQQALESCTGLTDEREITFCQIKQIGQLASSISSVYSGVQSATQLLQLIGAIPTPPTVQQLLQNLDDHLSRIGVALGTQQEEAIRNSYRPDSIANAEQARQLALLGQQIAMDSETYKSSRADALKAMSEAAFQRVYSGPDFLHTPFLPARDDGAVPPVLASPGDLVYDWRIGLGDLMQTIADRIVVLSSADANWGTSDLVPLDFTGEMQGYHDALLSHYQRMEAGVKCVVSPNCAPTSCGFGCGVIGTPGPPVVECQDIYAGTNIKYTGTCGENLEQKKTEITHQIYQKMPFFSLRKLIDLLYTYAHPAPDLTQTFGQFEPEEQTYLCADIQNGNYATGTPVWLYPCNWDNAQWWSYDRKTGIITNPPSGKCLDVQWANPAFGTPLWLWDCTPPDQENPAQRWSYDPQGKRLYSELGPDLVLAQSGTMKQLTLGIEWSNPEFDAGQYWHAD